MQIQAPEFILQPCLRNMTASASAASSSQRSRHPKGASLPEPSLMTCQSSKPTRSSPHKENFFFAAPPTQSDVEVFTRQLGQLMVADSVQSAPDTNKDYLNHLAQYCFQQPGQPAVKKTKETPKHQQSPLYIPAPRTPQPLTHMSPCQLQHLSVFGLRHQVTG